MDVGEVWGFERFESPPAGRPELSGPSPMKAVNVASLEYRRVDPPEPVWVWVEAFPADAPQPGGWFPGELAEWTAYPDPVGWTGWVRFSTGASERFSGRFEATAMRPFGRATPGASSGD